MNALDQLLRRDAFLLGAQHDRRAVGVVGADVPAFVAAHLLEAHPDIGLDVLDQMAEVDRAVGVGQGAGNEDLAGHDPVFPGAGGGRMACRIEGLHCTGVGIAYLEYRFMYRRDGIHPDVGRYRRFFISSILA